jgi:hypothetical protein
MEFALIRNGIVENVIVAESDFMDHIRGQWDQVVEVNVDEKPGVGWIYDGSVFVPPEPLPDPGPTPAQIAFDELEAIVALIDPAGELKPFADKLTEVLKLSAPSIDKVAVDVPLAWNEMSILGRISQGFLS